MFDSTVAFSTHCVVFINALRRWHHMVPYFAPSLSLACCPAGHVPPVCACVPRLEATSRWPQWGGRARVTRWHWNKTGSFLLPLIREARQFICSSYMLPFIVPTIFLSALSVSLCITRFAWAQIHTCVCERRRGEEGETWLENTPLVWQRLLSCPAL